MRRGFETPYPAPLGTSVPVEAICTIFFFTAKCVFTGIVYSRLFGSKLNHTYVPLRMRTKMSIWLIVCVLAYI